MLADGCFRSTVRVFDRLMVRPNRPSNCDPSEGAGLESTEGLAGEVPARAGMGEGLQVPPGMQLPRWRLVGHPARLIPAASDSLAMPQRATGSKAASTALSDGIYDRSGIGKLALGTVADDNERQVALEEPSAPVSIRDSPESIDER